MNWFKQLWRNFWGGVIIRKAKPKMYYHDRESLRHRFDRIRTTAYTYRDQSEVSGKRLDLTGSVTPQEVDAYMEKAMSVLKKIPFTPENTDFSLRFNLADMTESCDSGWYSETRKLRESERSGSV